MRKSLSIMLAISLCFMCVCVISPAAYAQDARAMPVPFTFTDEIRLTAANFGDSFPPGWADYDVVITGQYDAQGDHVYSIQSVTCRYKGGLNCSDRDLEIVAWTTATERGYVFWRFEGSITFSWTDPITNNQIERVLWDSETFSFRAYEYME